MGLEDAFTNSQFLIRVKIKLQMDIKGNIKEFVKLLEGTGVTLVAVSKTKPVEDIMAAYETGQRDFGENKIQELRDKYPKLPKDIHWHMIGHLQTNKVKYIAPWIHLIHAVDSMKLLKEIDKQAAKNHRTIPCLLQVHIGEEETKFGLQEDELIAILESEGLKALKNTEISGLMGMATNTTNRDQIRQEFMSLKTLFEKVKSGYNLPNVNMKERSIGMSGDYPIAIEAGSTMIRVGSKIFGPRIYH